MIVGSYRVSNTNGNSYQKDAVRVYDVNNVKIAEVFPKSRNPLQYIRKHPKSKYRASLVLQLRQKNTPESIIEMMVSHTDFDGG